jgi:hypothetical protein
MDTPLLGTPLTTGWILLDAAIRPDDGMAANAAAPAAVFRNSFRVILLFVLSNVFFFNSDYIQCISPSIRNAITFAAKAIY